MKSIGKIRLSTQIFTFILVNIGILSVLETGIVCPVFYCHGCPAAGFACPIGSMQNFIAVREELRLFPFYLLGSLGLYAVALGRFWCGWACPFGTVQDLFIKIRGRKNIPHLFTVPWTKYVVLVGLLIAAWIALDSLFCKVCPSGSLFAAVPHQLIPSASDSQGQPLIEQTIGTFFWVHVATLVVAIFSFILIARFWCRYLCPLGAIFGLFNRVSFVKVTLDDSKCTGCRQCLDVCPTRIEEPEHIGNVTDCIQCGKCVEACSADALKISASIWS